MFTDRLFAVYISVKLYRFLFVSFFVSIFFVLDFVL